MANYDASQTNKSNKSVENGKSSKNEEKDNQEENEEIISDKQEMSADDIFGGESLEETDEIVKEDEVI